MEFLDVSYTEVFKFIRKRTYFNWYVNCTVKDHYYPLVEFMMKTLIALLIASASIFAFDMKELQSLEDDYLFDGHSLDEVSNRINSSSRLKRYTKGGVNYHPSLWSITSALDTLQEKYKGDGYWEELRLSFPKRDGLSKYKYYQDDVKALFHKTNSKNLIVIMNNSFTNLDSESWINKLAHLFAKYGINPNVLALPGFLSYEMLSFRPKSPDIMGAPGRRFNSKTFALE